MEKTIFILFKGEESWTGPKNEVELLKYLKDGSISEGDLIVYPERIMTAKNKLELQEDSTQEG